MRKKSVTVKQIQKLDKIAIEKYGVPSLVLMENAGRSVAGEVVKRVKRIRSPRVCIVCGSGNNAGDGFVAARHLINNGIKTSVYLIGRGSRLKHDAAVNYRILKKLKYPIKEIRKGRDRSLQDIKKADVTVDAVFGVGLNRDISGSFYNAIEAINKYSKKIISVDTPSGLDGTTGKIYGVCVRANVTVTFTFTKKGFLKGQGPKNTGKVIIVDIGIPVQIK